MSRQSETAAVAALTHGIPFFQAGCRPEERAQDPQKRMRKLVPGSHQRV